MEWTQILGLAFGIMMLFVLWPAYKHWSKNGPKAEKGDLNAVALPLVLVVLFVMLLIASVR